MSCVTVYQAAPYHRKNRQSAHVPLWEADCFALRHSYGGFGKRRCARKYAEQFTGINRVGSVSELVSGKATRSDCSPDRRPGAYGGTLVLRQNPDADVLGCDANDEGENDRSLTTSDTKPDRSTGACCSANTRNGASA
jgi:hypothetical protein